MNIAKNMEAIFVATAIIAGATTFATAGTPAPRIVMPADASTAQAVAVTNASAHMPVVTITAKRMTAAEKAAL